ncbi:tyrosine aminotransferase-like [Hydractinia symbiolongicarpus]|uniref:tyrosine aminotransferase-like n=1 Tax=Hydractinia symbiolongicarpus TaxID=13093 RepID=UPI0025514757|nr:tyrosine aminotransferase-like [Hydractinia symbiolongicarpus]
MNAHQGKDTKVISNGHNSPTMKNKEINGSSPKMHKKHKWCIPSSDMSRRTVNPIRRVVDTMRIEPNPSYSPISLSIGDPTVFGNLLPHPNMLEAIEESLHSHKHNGYGPAIGNLEARKAIAKCMTVPEAPLTEKDIVITSACSGAIEICIGTLANPGDNMLCPKPGFSLYKTIGTSNGVDVRYYNLMPNKEWEVDLEHMESLIDEKTKFIVVNNPSNPCGSVYTRQHLLAILEVAERNKLPILADEIYAYSVFSGETFYPLASLTTSVPVLSCCAISKRFLVPGWRLGWIQIHDRNDLFKEVRAGLADMATRILGANSIIQGALPRILRDTPQDWFDENMAFIEDITNVACNSLSKVPGLKCIRPRGAMYMMVGIDKTILKSIKDDIHFTTDLMAKKSVFCLPGTCFQFPDYFRVVLTVPRGMVEEACARIEEYCREIIEQNSVD